MSGDIVSSKEENVQKQVTTAGTTILPVKEAPQTKNDQVNSDGDDDFEEEEEDNDDDNLLSVDKRWQRKSTIINLVKSGNFTTHLAVDLISGREVYWNTLDMSTVSFTAKERKSIADHLKIINSLRKAPYVVNYRAYWIEEMSNEFENSLKVYLITENFGSVSLHHFLQSIKTKVDHLSWSRWCQEILLGINFLHSNNPPLVHGSINPNTVFFDQTGVLKLCFIGITSEKFFGKIDMQSISKSVQKRPFDYSPLEFKRYKKTDKSLDIYDFGLVALKIGIASETTPEGVYTPFKYIDLIENVEIKRMLRKCLSSYSNDRPSASELLKHCALFAMPSLRAIILNKLIDNESFFDDHYSRLSKLNKKDVLFEHKYSSRVIRVEDFELFKDRELVDRIKNNQEPSLVMIQELRRVNSQTFTSLESELTPPNGDNEESADGKKYDSETRRISTLDVSLDASMTLIIQIMFTDNTKRELKTKVSNEDKGIELAEDLVFNGLLNEYDIHNVASQIQEIIGA